MYQGRLAVSCRRSRAHFLPCDEGLERRTVGCVCDRRGPWVRGAVDVVRDYLNCLTAPSCNRHRTIVAHAPHFSTKCTSKKNFRPSKAEKSLEKLGRARRADRFTLFTQGLGGGASTVSLLTNTGPGPSLVCLIGGKPVCIVWLSERGSPLLTIEYLDLGRCRDRFSLSKAWDFMNILWNAYA
jgi:hypothetical protein